MSEKRMVTTFIIHLVQSSEVIEGPVVAPDKRLVAESLDALHTLIQTHGAILIYDKQWIYLPANSIYKVLRGKNLFSLPWPLRHDGNADSVTHPMD